MGEKPRIRDSEIRAFLLKYALRKGIRVVEFTSDDPGRSVCYYAHLESPANGEKPRETATAVSNEGKDSALVKAFLYMANRELDFLPENL